VKIVTVPERPVALSRLAGGMKEERLLCSSGTDGEERWEMIQGTLSRGTSVLPVPFPTEELGMVLSGRVELTELPFDYDVGLSLEEQAVTVRVGPGDAFHFLPGERIWMEVLEDAVLVYTRKIPAK
jgi:hypothetical protein